MYMYDEEKDSLQIEKGHCYCMLMKQSTINV
jgi:hypothetical protein